VNRAILIAVLVVFVTTLAGCQSGDRIVNLRGQVEKLQEQNKSRTQQLEQCRREKDELTERLDNLTALKSAGALQDLYQLRRVEIVRFTDFYDKDNDGAREKLIVYVQPLDTSGDPVKVPGTVRITLWNLSKPQEDALLGQWQIGAEELAGLWYDTFIETSYRFVFDATEFVDERADALTVRMSFTSHLTGRVFKDQRVIEP